MHRRTLLTSIGALGAVTLTGCMTTSGETTDDPQATPTTDAPPRTTADELPDNDPTTSGIRPADGVTPEPAPDFEGVPCPPPGRNVDRQVCSLTTDLDDADVALVPPRPARFDVSGDEGTVGVFECSLRNQTEVDFGFNPYDWALKRYEDGSWVHVAPEMTPEPWTRLAPGESFTYGLSVEPHPTPDSGGYQAIVQDVQSGVYALVVDGMLEAGEGGERVECVAVFEVVRE